MTMAQANALREQLLSRTRVTAIELTLAKKFLLRQASLKLEPRRLIPQFVREMGAETPQQIVIHQRVDPEPAIRNAALYFTAAQALGEAIWALIGEGVYLPMGVHETWNAGLGWTTVVPGSGGTSEGWAFPEFEFEYPVYILRAPSRRSDAISPLTDGDLFQAHLDIPSAHPEVQESLRDAVACFRHELYRPAVYALGKAAEGAWTELGLALTKALSDAALEAEYRSEETGFFRRIRGALELFESAQASAFRRSAKLRPMALRTSATWSDVLRDARNAIHLGAEPNFPNNHEKTSTLLLGAGQHLSTIYSVAEAATGYSSGRPLQDLRLK